MARLFYHTSDLDVEVNHNMSRNRSKAVPEGNGPVPHHYEFGSGDATMADLYRILEENFDRQLNRIKSHFDRKYKRSGKRMEKMRATTQRLAALEHKARQPRFATGVDVEPDIETRKCTEGTAVDRAKNGYSSSARVNAGATSLTIFGMIAEPLWTAPEHALLTQRR